jgi:hypothetical protein
MHSFFSQEESLRVSLQLLLKYSVIPRHVSKPAF